MNPEKQLLIQCIILRASEHWFVMRNLPADSSVDILDSFEGGRSFRTRVEDNRPHSTHGAVQTTEWIFLKPAVLGNAGRDSGMGQLHQQRASAGCQQDHLAIDLPNLAVELKKPLAIFPC